MPPTMTETAWRQGTRNALVCGVGFLLAWGASAAALWRFLGLNVRASCSFAFAILWGASLLVFLGTWLYGKRAGGQLLLDCGPHPTKKLFMLNALIFLVLGLTNGVFGRYPQNNALRFAGPVFALSFASYWIIMGTGRLQVRENGIWQYSGLIRWDRIDAYQWADDSTLLLNVRGFFPLRRGALPVPPEHKQAFDALLAKHCPARAERDATAGR